MTYALVNRTLVSVVATHERILRVVTPTCTMFTLSTLLTQSTDYTPRTERLLRVV